jgi:hypothetical protein
VQIVRLHDSSRRPASWMEVIRPGQFAVFARIEPSGGPCDAEGLPFASPDAASCAIFESFAEARAFCEAAVERHPAVRYDLFDSGGRTQPALLTVTHRDRSSGLETGPVQTRRRRVLAWVLIGVGAPLVAYATLVPRERESFLPAFLGLSMIIFGGRILWLNLALRETERAREARVAAATAESPAAPPRSADPSRSTRPPAPQ